MATYNIATTAIDAGSLFAVKTDILPDPQCVNGGQALAMQQGAQIQYKKADG